jgi:hypothetical protein
MPHPLNLACGSSGTLLVHRQRRMLLHASPGGVVLKVDRYCVYLANEVIPAWK